MYPSRSAQTDPVQRKRPISNPKENKKMDEMK
jgi:hypothetical protein